MEVGETQNFWINISNIGIFLRRTNLTRKTDWDCILVWKFESKLSKAII